MTSNRAGGDGLGNGDSAADLYRKWRHDTDAGRESRQEDTRILDSQVQKMNSHLDSLVSERSRLQAEQQRLSDLINAKAEEAEIYEIDLNRLEAYMRANDVNIGLIVQALNMARDSNIGLKRKYLEFLKNYNQERSEEEERKRERNASLQNRLLQVENKQLELTQLEAEMLRIQRDNKRKVDASHSTQAKCQASQLTIEMAKMELEKKTGEISTCLKRTEEEAHLNEINQLRVQLFQMQEKAKALLKEKNQFMLEGIVLNADVCKMKEEVDRHADMLYNQSQIIKNKKGQRDLLDRDMQVFFSTTDGQYEQTRRRLDDMSSQLIDNSIEICKLEEVDVEWKSKCKDLRIEIAAQEKSVSDVAVILQEMEHVEEDLEKARAEVPRINAQAIKLKEQIDNLKQVEREIYCLQTEKESLEDQYRTVTEEISHLENAVQVKGDQTKVEESAVLNSLKSDADHAEAEYENELQLIDEEEAEEEKLKSTIMAMNDNVNAMDAAGSRRLQIIQDKNKQLLFQLASENDALEVEINNLKSEAGKLQVEQGNRRNAVAEQQPKSIVAQQKENQSSGSYDSDDSDIFRLFSSPKKMTPEKAGKKFFKRK
jgi:hypothetical protein